MNHRALALGLTFLGLACGPGSDPSNPPQLWLSLRGSETEVQLVAEEPPPF